MRIGRKRKILWAMMKRRRSRDQNPFLPVCQRRRRRAAWRRRRKRGRPSDICGARKSDCVRSRQSRRWRSPKAGPFRRQDPGSASGSSATSSTRSFSRRRRGIDHVTRRSGCDHSLEPASRSSQQCLVATRGRSFRRWLCARTRLYGLDAVNRRGVNPPIGAPTC